MQGQRRLRSSRPPSGPGPSQCQSQLHSHCRRSLEIWEFPDLIEREEGADRLGVRDAEKTKKKRKREAREISLLRRPQQI